MNYKKVKLRYIVEFVLSSINLMNLYIAIGVTNSYEIFIGYLTWILPSSIISLTISLVLFFKYKSFAEKIHIAVAFLSALTIIVSTIFVFIRYSQYYL